MPPKSSTTAAAAPGAVPAKKKDESEYEDDYEPEEADEEEEYEDDCEEEEEESDEDDEEESDEEDGDEEDDDAGEDPLVFKVRRSTDRAVAAASAASPLADAKKASGKPMLAEWSLLRLPNDVKYRLFACEAAERAGVPPNVQVEIAYIPQGVAPTERVKFVPIASEADLAKASDAYFNGSANSLRVVVEPTAAASATLMATVGGAAGSAPPASLGATAINNTLGGASPMPRGSSGNLSAGTPLEGRPMSPGGFLAGGDSSADLSMTAANAQLRALLDDPAVRVVWKEMRVLGTGAFGRVSEAITSNGRLVAVKHLVVPTDAPACMASTSSDAEELVSEIKLLKLLRHRHIVEYYGCQTYLEEDGSRVLDIFMEHCHGGSINALRKKFDKKTRRLSVALARNYTRQILEGLAYLHSQGVVHRDIKGDNVLIAGNGDAKLSDFGCSKKIGTSQQSGPVTSSDDHKCQTLIGTPLFMAPEVMREEAGGYDSSADIWSMGCLVLELFGRAAWVVQGTGLFAIMFAVASSDKLPTGMPDKCSDAMRQFLVDCFNRDAKNRPTAENLLMYEWMTMPDHMLTEPEWEGEAPVVPETPAGPGRGKPTSL